MKHEEAEEKGRGQERVNELISGSPVTRSGGLHRCWEPTGDSQGNFVALI